MLIIGLGYRAHSGKDTVGQFLVERYGFRRLAFADRLKRATAAILDLSPEQLYGDLKEVRDPYWGFTSRWALQQLGEGIRDLIARDVWIRATLRDIEQHGGNVVVTDVRYRNEVAAIKSLGGYVVQVWRSELYVTNGVPGHPSETELQDLVGWDYILTNDGSLETLGKKTDEMMTHFGTLGTLGA